MVVTRPRLSGSTEQGAPSMRLGPQLLGVGRCPHCAIASPQLLKLWQSEQPIPRSTPGPESMWAIYRWTSCGGVLLAKGKDNDRAGNAVVVELFPTSRQVGHELPPAAALCRTSLSDAARLGRCRSNGRERCRRHAEGQGIRGRIALSTHRRGGPRSLADGRYGQMGTSRSVGIKSAAPCGRGGPSCNPGGSSTGRGIR